MEITSHQTDIEGIIDRTLTFWIENEVNKLPCDIEAEMLAPVQTDDEWKTWLPVKSTVTDTELEIFEAETGFVFPEDFKIFLKHKHFYELQISEVSFCSHPINLWRASLREKPIQENFFLIKDMFPLLHTVIGGSCVLILIMIMQLSFGIMKLQPLLNINTKVFMNY